MGLISFLIMIQLAVLMRDHTHSAIPYLAIDSESSSTCSKYSGNLLLASLIILSLFGIVGFVVQFVSFFNIARSWPKLKSGRCIFHKLCVYDCIVSSICGCMIAAATRDLRDNCVGKVYVFPDFTGSTIIGISSYEYNWYVTLSVLCFFYFYVAAIFVILLLAYQFEAIKNVVAALVTSIETVVTFFRTPKYGTDERDNYRYENKDFHESEPEKVNICTIDNLEYQLQTGWVLKIACFIALADIISDLVYLGISEWANSGLHTAAYFFVILPQFIGIFIFYIINKSLYQCKI